MFSFRCSRSPVPGMASTCGPGAGSRPGAPAQGWRRALRRPPRPPHRPVRGSASAGGRPAMAKNGTNAMPRSAAQVEQSVDQRPRSIAVPVLHAHHRRDRQRLVELVGADVGHARGAGSGRRRAVGERAELLGDRVAPPALRGMRRFTTSRWSRPSWRRFSSTWARSWSRLGPGSQSPDGSRPGPTFVVITRSSG